MSQFWSGCHCNPTFLPRIWSSLVFLVDSVLARFFSLLENQAPQWNHCAVLLLPMFSFTSHGKHFSLNLDVIKTETCSSFGSNEKKTWVDFLCQPRLNVDFSICFWIMISTQTSVCHLLCLTLIRNKWIYKNKWSHFNILVPMRMKAECSSFRWEAQVKLNLSIHGFCYSGLTSCLSMLMFFFPIKSVCFVLLQIIGIGLCGVFELIKETRFSHPLLCLRSLQALLDMLQGQQPEGFQTEPPDVLGNTSMHRHIHHLLKHHFFSSLHLQHIIIFL